MKRFLLVVLLFTVSISNAQFEDIFAAEGDANQYLTKFMTPFFHGMLHASSAGWSNSAKPLRPFSFALDISASGALIPKDAEHFTFRQSDYQYLRISSGSSEIPTVLGGDAHTRLEIVIPINGGTEQKVMEFDFLFVKCLYLLFFCSFLDFLLLTHWG